MKYRDEIGDEIGMKSPTVSSASGCPAWWRVRVQYPDHRTARTRKDCSALHFRVKCRVVDLVSLLSRHEGKTLELKRDLSSPDGVLKAIVAFANTSGGIIVFGVEDRTRRVKGIADVLAEEERLANLIADSISPKMVPSMEVLPWRKTQTLAVEIYPSPNRPHHLNRLGPAAGVFVRVGSTNRRADSFLIEEMRRYNQVSSFDEQPMPDLNSEAIDFRAASEYFKPIRKLTPHGLQSLKLTAGYQGRIVPTTGGVLLFGAARLRHFPDAWIQALNSSRPNGKCFRAGECVPTNWKMENSRQETRF